jgi:hypothetical protein
LPFVFFSDLGFFRDFFLFGSARWMFAFSSSSFGASSFFSFYYRTVLKILGYSQHTTDITANGCTEKQM